LQLQIKMYSYTGLAEIYYRERMIYELSKKYLTEALRLIDQSKDGNLFGYEQARIFLNRAASRTDSKDMAGAIKDLKEAIKK
jgi:hypothetical protein